MNEPQLTLEWDSRDLEVFRGGKIEKALRDALSKAGGDAIRFIRTGTTKLVRQRKRMKLARLRAGLPLFFPRSKAEISQLVWRMDVSGEPVPLSEFPYRVVRRKEGRRHGGGVMVQVNVGRRTLVRSAFVARMQSGHVGIFRRRGEERLPIDEAFTSRISDVAQDSGFIPFVQAGAQARFASSFQRVLPLELGKLKQQ
jgi:hypothetical protein